MDFCGHILFQGLSEVLSMAGNFKTTFDQLDFNKLLRNKNGKTSKTKGIKQLLQEGLTTLTQGCKAMFEGFEKLIKALVLL